MWTVISNDKPTLITITGSSDREQPESVSVREFLDMEMKDKVILSLSLPRLSDRDVIKLEKIRPRAAVSFDTKYINTFSQTFLELVLLRYYIKVPDT